ncbi:MAG: hypothetical protein M3Y07_17590 [Acidobacteriota bacterium]|nr:hypothetical protein [Acidobacteriota bacterium]
MIQAAVIRAINELLEKRGILQNPGEEMGDYVARGLGISAQQTEEFLQAVHDGVPLEEAERKARIPAA